MTQRKTEKHRINSFTLGESCLVTETREKAKRALVELLALVRIKVIRQHAF